MGARAHLAPHLAGSMGIHSDVHTIDGCTQARRLGDCDRHCRAPTFARMIFRQAVRFPTLWGAHCMRFLRHTELPAARSLQLELRRHCARRGIGHRL